MYHSVGNLNEFSTCRLAVIRSKVVPGSKLQILQMTSILYHNGAYTYGLFFLLTGGLTLIFDESFLREFLGDQIQYISRWDLPVDAR